MAADSRAMYGEDGYHHLTRKLFRVGGDLIGIAGQQVSCLRFVAWYEDGADPDAFPEFGEDEYSRVLVLTTEGLFRYEHSPYPVPILDDAAAIGTGRDVALTAMRFGKSPHEAVEVACEINLFTGPPVVSERL